MKLIQHHHTIIFPATSEEWLRIAKIIERAGRICYRSEDKITDDSYQKMLKSLVKRGHHSPLEHSMMTVEFDTDRGVQQELTRHRLASYSIESTRYVNYAGSKAGGECKFVEPSTLDNWSEKRRKRLVKFLELADQYYCEEIADGAKPQEARAFLTLCTAGKIVMTANWREWRHIFKLRTKPDCHPDIIDMMDPLLLEVEMKMPCVFGDIRGGING